MGAALESSAPPNAKPSFKTRFKAWWEGYDVADLMGEPQPTEPVLGPVAAEATAASLPPLEQPHIKVAQSIWGESLTGPGGVAAILTLVKPFALDPMDAYPDDMVMAELADYLERHTLLKIERILRSWAGLRSFVPDHCPVVGLDPRAEGFFWLAGQGGYGIMMSPVLGRATASLIDTGALPEDLKERGLTPADLAPGRAALREPAVTVG